MRIEKPWGYEELVYSGSNYVFKKLFMKEGEACSLQYHEKKHETVLIHSGRLRVSIGSSLDDIKDTILEPGETVVLAPGVLHRMTALEDCVYFESSTPELDDVIRLDDRYGRTSANN